MNRFRALLLFALLFVSFVPALASAQSGFPLFDPTWQLVPDPSLLDESCEPDDPLAFGAVLQLVQNTMNLAVALTALILIGVIVYAGALFMSAAANAEGISKAKSTFMNAAVGFLIVIAAWLVVDSLMKVFYVGETGNDANFLPWNQIFTGGPACIQKDPNQKSLFQNLKIGEVPTVRTGVTLGGGQGGPTAGGGSCRVAQSGPCSVAELQKTCFANRADAASRICNLESAGGNPRVKSGSDRLNSGTGQSYSVGLWQINLTVHKVAGLDCPSAFTMTCGRGNGSLIGPSKPGACRATIKPGMERLYEQCVSAAQNPVNNTTTACKLYGSGTFQPWSYSANKCSVPKS